MKGVSGTRLTVSKAFMAESQFRGSQQKGQRGLAEAAGAGGAPSPAGGGDGRLARDTVCVYSPQEKQDKAVLQAEVQHLRQDNRRLQEESQTATAQLRKFTEWFFNTIDKKS